LAQDRVIVTAVRVDPSARKHWLRQVFLLRMPSRSLSSQSVGLLVWLLAAFAAGALGALASVDAASFYSQLSKPSWAPPASVFGPVWSALYALMGVSAWLVWRSPGSNGVALGLFVVQLAANALWSWMFFAWHRGALAAVEVLVLAALIVATAVAFWRTSRLAALLLAPYLLWVSFASVLTWALWRSNPGLL
jgi:tryptophan-rich sensory protein